MTNNKQPNKAMGEYVTYSPIALLTSFRLSFFLLFVFIGSNIFAQTSSLNSLIRTDLSVEEKQEKIDQFFKEHKDMSKDSLADCHHDLALRWYFRQFRQTRNDFLLKKAIKETQIAIQLKQEIQPAPKTSIQKSRINLGFFLIEDLQLFEAIKNYKALVSLGLINRKTFIGYRQLSECLAEVGDFYKAINAIEKGISINKGEVRDVEQLALAYYNLADNYAHLGYREYSNLIRENLIIADSLNLLSASKERKKIQLAQTINHLEGNRLIRIDNYVAAQKLLESNIASFAPDDAENLAIAYNSLGFTKLKLSDTEAAFKDLNTAIAYNPNYTASYENLGDYYLEQKDFINGMRAYQKAIDISINKSKPTVHDQLPEWEFINSAINKKELLNHLVQKAKGWMTFYSSDQNKDHLLKALATFEIADKLIDEIRFLSLEEQSKLFWSEKGTALYLRAVEACYLLEKPAEAYYFMEKNKALLLLGDLTNEQAKENSQIPESITSREFQLKRSIFLLEHQLHQTTDEGSELKDEISSVKNKLINFKDSIASLFPTYAKASNQIELKSYSAFNRDYVSDDQVVLQYIMNEKNGFALFHSREGVHFYQIEGYEDLVSDLVDFYQQVGIPVNSSTGLMDQQQLSHSIFNRLIPAEAYNSIKGKRLIIIPDYLLQQLPFEALVSKREPSTYLLEEATIQYAYSISYLDLNKKLVRRPSNNFIGFSPQDFDDGGLSDLKYNLEEVKEINAICNGEIYSNKLATKAKFLSQQHDAKIIHLSTHADAGKEIRPWIAFKDEKLFIDEIYATKNQSELVVLSGCNTSIGELKKGEGAMSLARAFFYAGTNSVLASLWPANDKASKTLMVDFYKELETGADKSTALRNAKLNYLNSKSGSEVAPFFWASTILIGNDDAIDLSSNWSFWTFGILGVILFFIIFYLLRIKLK